MEPIRVLIADDSPTCRSLLNAILSQEGDLQVVGEATNGIDAVRLAEQLAPDVIVMDVHMPDLDGIGATRQIMVRSPTPIVVVSAVSQSDLNLSLAATQAGALIALPKPGSTTSPRFEQQRTDLVFMVRAMAQVKVVRHWTGERRVGGLPRRERRSEPVELIAIAASTGGPAALRRLLGALPAGMDVPILIVQHIAREFTSGFAKWLDGGTAAPVRLASDGERLEGGTVYVAPDDVHTGVDRNLRVQISHTEGIGGFRPSATFLFDSVARAVGPRGVGVIMTGMGSDGAQGLLALHEAGGYVIAQDERSSVVFGMAQAAVRCGAVDEVLPLEQIADRLIELVRGESE